jgi:hypothetical protein
MITFTAFNNEIAYNNSPLLWTFQKNITTTTSGVIVLLYKGTKEVDTNYSAPIMSKITFTSIETVHTYFNFSIHRCAMYFRV